MAATVKVRKIGNSLGLLLPKEVAEQLHLAEGDTLHVITDADDARLTPTHCARSPSNRANSCGADH